MLLLQNCNVQFIDTANNNVLYDFKNGNRGTAPCHLQVTNTGTLVVVSANNIVWSIDAAPVQATPGASTMAPGQGLPQVCSLER